MRLHRIRRNEYCGNCVVADLQFADLTDRLAFGRSRIQLLSSPNVRALLATPPSLSLLRRDNCHATSILEEVLLIGPSFRGALGTRMLACASFGAVAFIAFAACTRDQPTSPLASHRVPGQGASYTVTTLGTYSIPIPATNWPGDGAQPVTNTGIIVPAGAYYRVRVKGTVTVSTNPVHAATFSGTNYSLNGTYGPGGIGSYSQLLVVLKARFTDGSGANPVNLANLSYGTSAPDSAQSNIMFANKEVEIQAGRNGVGCASNNNQGSGTIGCYALTANQIVTVQKYTNFVHLTATPSAVRSGQQVTFQATSDEAGLVSYGWVWTRDPGTNANPANGCNSWVTLCTAQIYGSGTMTANTNYGSASAHVTVYTNFTLGATPTTVDRGDTVTFTPMYNGVAGGAARWRWVSDSTPDSPSCASANPACKTPINASGTMWAYTALSGGDSASAHIAVRDKYELRAAPSLIAAGQVVTFRPYLNGQAAPAMRWRWVPQGAAWDNVAGCTNGTTECHRATFVSGVMWAYRTSGAGGDSASATVVVSADCGTGLSIRRPANGRTVGTRRGSRSASPRTPSRTSTGTGTCSDSLLSIGDSGTDSLPLVPLTVQLETGGIDVEPPQGTTLWPSGTVIPVKLTAQPNYQTPLVFMDDTLYDTLRVVTMNQAHTIAAVADHDFNQDPEVLALRSRLRNLVTAQSRQAYAQYLVWLSDSSAGAVLHTDSLETKLGIAEYLEFDLGRAPDRAALLAYDATVGGTGYELYGPVGARTVAIIDSAHFFAPPPIMANRIGVRRTTTTTAASGRVTYIYINGIRTTIKDVNDVTNHSGTLVHLGNVIVEDSVLNENARVTFFYNRNVAAQLAAFDSASSCYADAARGGGIRHGIYLAVRFAKCRVAEPVVRLARHVAEADIIEAMTEMARINYNVPTGAPPADADSLAERLAAYYHRDSSDVIFVTHSQGNMILADAKHVVDYLDAQYQAPERCVAALSFASPIRSTKFAIDGRVLGMMMENDILFMVGADNDMTRTTDDRTAQATSELADETNPFKHFMKRYHWGLAIHDVNWNYLQYPASVDMVQGYLRQLRGLCVTP